MPYHQERPHEFESTRYKRMPILHGAVAVDTHPDGPHSVLQLVHSLRRGKGRDRRQDAGRLGDAGQPYAARRQCFDPGEIGRCV